MVTDGVGAELVGVAVGTADGVAELKTGSFLEEGRIEMASE